LVFARAPHTELPHSPAADRNKQPILDVLRAVLPPHGRALEIASGTGQHSVWFAAALPQWTWQPSDADEAMLPAIAARTTASGLANVMPPLLLDVMSSEWPVQGRFDAIYCANMLHISPWPTSKALMQGGARYLAAAGLLVTYGPYLEDGVATSPGNQAFDESLRARDPAWGIRRREEMEREAGLAGLVLRQRYEMPANNLLLVFALAQAWPGSA
jgi:hypothetical protein